MERKIRAWIRTGKTISQNGLDYEWQEIILDEDSPTMWLMLMEEGQITKMAITTVDTNYDGRKNGSLHLR